MAGLGSCCKVVMNLNGKHITHANTSHTTLLSYREPKMGETSVCVHRNGKHIEDVL